MLLISSRCGITGRGEQVSQPCQWSLSGGGGGAACGGGGGHRLPGCGFTGQGHEQRILGSHTG